MASNRSHRFNKLRLFFLEGTSTYDAWLSASSFQVAQVLLTLPMSTAQMGYPSGVVFQIAYGLMGCWSVYMAACLYVNYRDKIERQNTYRQNHDIQWYEVLDGLLGPYWKFAGLFFNVALLITQGSITILGASNLSYSLNQRLNKRTWTILLVPVFLLTAFIPKTQNYRIWSFAGIVMTTYTAWFMTTASLIHGQKESARHTGPHSYTGYFTGTTNILYAFGGHGITIELVHGMKEPRKFKFVYICTVLYIWALTIPSAVTVYWAFGDELLHNPYALVMFSKTKFRDTALVLMIIHQFIQFGICILPIYLMWEKALGIHGSDKYILISLARIPVALFVWFLALMLPFIGLIDSLVGTFFTSFSIHILPCLAQMIVHRSSKARQTSLEQPPFWLIGGWVGFYCINLLVVLWIIIVGFGFGAWSGSIRLAHSVNEFGLFAKCYRCINQ